jgi:hypothetical protein
MAESSKEIGDIDVEKNCIVQEPFVDTADDNYVIARWCFSQRQYIDFYWLAVHTLEKYLKATLLLNGYSARSYNHNISRLYADVERSAGELLPKGLPKPSQLPKLFWRDETAVKFIRRLYRYGNEHNRYNLFGYEKFGEDLYKLDTMVFRIRRLCYFLDKYYLPRHARHREEDKFTYRTFLLLHSNHWESVAGGRLTEIVEGRHGNPLQFAALNHNLAFAKEEFRHGRMPNSTAAHNPVLLRYVLDPLGGRGSDKARLVAEDVCDWVLKNVYVPNDVAQQLREALAKSRQKKS